MLFVINPNSVIQSKYGFHHHEIITLGEKVGFVLDTDDLVVESIPFDKLYTLLKEQKTSLMGKFMNAELHSGKIKIPYCVCFQEYMEHTHMEFISLLGGKIIYTRSKRLKINGVDVGLELRYDRDVVTVSVGGTVLCRCRIASELKGEWGIAYMYRYAKFLVIQIAFATGIGFGYLTVIINGVGEVVDVIPVGDGYTFHKEMQSKNPELTVRFTHPELRPAY